MEMAIHWNFREPLLALLRRAKGIPPPKITRQQALEIAQDYLSRWKDMDKEPYIVKSDLLNYEIHVDPFSRDGLVVVLVDMQTGQIKDVLGGGG